MKIGSRPIWRIARTGEFTPPGRTFRARSLTLRVPAKMKRVRLASAAPSGGRTQGGRMAAPFGRLRTTPREVCAAPPGVRGSSWRALLGVRRLPLGVIRSEVVEADLLVLGRRVEGGAVVRAHLAGLGDRVEHRVALLFRAAVGHREDA